jgi:hypothetical protein
MDSGCSRYMIGDKKWFSGLTPLSQKEYVTFGDDKKGKVLGTDIIKVNASVSQLVDADLSVLFRKSNSRVLDSSGGLVYGVSQIGNVFQADFSFAQSSLRCLLSQSFLEL